jgi:hypothetical protein
LRPAEAAPAGGLASKLRRVTSSGAFIPEIDGLRFIAAASVLAYHINGELLEVAALKGAGARTCRADRRKSVSQVALHMIPAFG